MPEMSIKTAIKITKNWNSEKIKKLKNLSDQGFSTSLIAERLGISKNAVVGKLYRLGWNETATANTTDKPVIKKIRMSKKNQREYWKMFSLAHRQELRDRAKLYRILHPEYAIKYKAEHKEEIKASRKKYRKEHAEALNAKARLRYQQKKAEILQCLEEIKLLKTSVQELQNQLNVLQQKNPYKDYNGYMYA